MAISFRTSAFPACCGLEISHNLGISAFGTTGQTRLAKVAVTNIEQNNSGVGQQLQEAGYAQVGTFLGNYHNALTLWLKQRATRDSTRSPLSTTYVSRHTGRPVTVAWALRNPDRVRSV